MQKKDILELKKRFKKNDCTFTKVCGCYVSNDQRILLQFRETFLTLEEEDAFKYLDIAGKIISGGMDNQILTLQFPLDETLENQQQTFLYQLKKSQLKDDELLHAFYQSVIDQFDHDNSNYLILLFHDAYDVITKTSDKAKLDESEEVYEYLLCAICPVTLSEPGLRYDEQVQRIKARARDWVVEKPVVGFVFPAFVERSPDVNTVMYYTKNPKSPHPEVMAGVLGCLPKQTATLQRESFQMIVKDCLGPDDEKGERALMEIHENLRTMVEDHAFQYDGVEEPPFHLDQQQVQQLMQESGIPQEAAAKIELSYRQCFDEDVPLAKHLMDPKILKAGEQRKKETRLERQVETLQVELEKVSSDLQPDMNEVILRVNPEKASQITTQRIDGQRCLVIPLQDNEQATINGQRQESEV